jgi:isoleucyl-tRNA synthetase
MSQNRPDKSCPFRPVEDVNHSTGRELEVQAWWSEHDIFRRSVQEREGAPDFVFYEGPPTANGLPGVHHVQSRTYKDLVCRLKTMEGYRVLRKAGWDTHGLPVEIEVEKRLGIEHKAEIEAFGVEAFNARCKESVRAYEEDWRRLTERIGFWIDLDDPYFTFKNEYIESVWWILSRFFQQGLVYQGHRILPYCPRCGTPLSSHEVSLGYRDAEDPSIYVRFPVADPGPAVAVLADLPEGIPRSLLVWTTTPWTLISNTFTVVHADLEYVEIDLPVQRPAVHKSLDARYGEDWHRRTYALGPEGAGRERLILARSRALTLFGDGSEWAEGVTEMARFRGADLLGLAYRRPFEFVTMDTARTHRVFADTYVTDEDGTGIVHSSPAYGEDDYATGRREEMPVVEPVDEEGRFVPEVTPWAGTFVKKADPGIIEDLVRRGLMLRAETLVHTYPFCWRCDSPLLYMARPSWYIRTTAIKDRLLAANREINWIPAELGSGRMGEWLENNQDWALSRDRYWGTPLPIWRCDAEGCDRLECLGSIEELRDRAGDQVPEEVDLHKPFVDAFTWTCTGCGRGTMRRTPEVIDVWFDSGSMPYAQWHYPFENREVFERQFPADFISEGIDQTRGWFYSLLAIGVLLFDRPSFKNVLVTEMVLDKAGQKMSKSRGNAADPWQIVDRWGADPLRWYLLTNSPPWSVTRFDEEGVTEASRKFFGTLHNTHAFFVLYARADGFHPGHSKNIALARRPLLDRWLLSRLATTTRGVRRALGRYDITRAARSLQEFVIEDLSNWYVRRSRRRFWKGEAGRDKESAYQTLHETLTVLAGLLAPFIPFTAEELWRNLQGWRPEGPESVHLSEYPAGDTDAIDKDLERRMDFVRRTVVLGRAARNRIGLKVRQPLGHLYVTAPDGGQAQALQELGELLKEELNIKEVVAVESASSFLGVTATPVFSRLGPRLGPRINQAAAAIRALDPDRLQALQRGEGIDVPMDGEAFTLTLEDVTLDESEPEHLAVEREGELVVAVDTRLDDGLLREGLVREFVSRVQTLRRRMEYAVVDRIQLGYEASPGLAEAIEHHRSYVTEETLAIHLQAGMLPSADSVEDWEVDGERVRVSIARP